MPTSADPATDLPPPPVLAPPVSVPPMATPRVRPVARWVPVVRQALHRLAGWAVVGLVLVAVGTGGLWVRRWAWASTEPVRFQADIDNAFRQGTRTRLVGYVDRYDDEVAEPQHAWVMPLDYGPGRLAVATLWAGWVRRHVDAPSVGPDPAVDQWTVEFYPRARQLGLTYELCRPLLMFNITGEVLAAAAVFGLVRRYASAWGTRPVRGTALATAAASLFFLDPALIWNAHCWPQWDSWVLPFLLWGLLLAAWDWWFCAGLAIAAGAMFKGQILFGAAMFVLWPLWQGRVGAVGRWVTGLAVGVAATTGVWLVRVPGHLGDSGYAPGHANPAAVGWVIDVAVAAVLVMLAVRPRAAWGKRLMPPEWAGWADRDPSGRRVVGAVAAMVVALIGSAGLTAAGVWSGVEGATSAGVVLLATAAGGVAWVGWVAGVVPAGAVSRVPSGVWVSARVTLGLMAVAAVGVPLERAGVGPLWKAAAAVFGFAALVAWVPARSLGHAYAAAVAAALLLCLPLFGGSDRWFQFGIAHGTTARPQLSVGPDNNLANLLGQVWDWNLEDPVVTLPPWAAADRVGAFLTSIDQHVRLPTGRPVSLPLKYLLLLIWVAATVLCSFGAARHDRSRDPRFLLAVAAPWVAMFAVMGQMHQRYLLWGAALTCMSVAVSPGLVALHLFLAVVSVGQELLSMAGGRDADRVAQDLVGKHPDWWSYQAVRTFYEAARGWTPGMGWAVVLTAGVFVYASVAPARPPAAVTLR